MFDDLAPSGHLRTQLYVLDEDSNEFDDSLLGYAQKSFPEMHNSIVSVTKLKGSEARECLHTTFAKLCGMFGMELHSAFLHALMIYIWSVEDSPRQNIVFMVVLQYVYTGHHDLQAFRKQCKDVFTSGASSAEFLREFTSADIPTHQDVRD